MCNIHATHLYDVARKTKKPLMKYYIEMGVYQVYVFR